MNLKVLPALLLLPLLGACGPVASLLANAESDGPAPRRAGPLTVGQTWTVSGPIDGRTVTTTVNIPDLFDVPDGNASVNGRDQADAFSSGRAGFTVATFDPSRRTLRFDWIAENGGVYSCQIETLLSMPYNGRLTLRSAGTTAMGTCTATTSS
ncbi:hypothetical protein LAJ19_07710 [Deinococcus taeanensis]|uniref:hypothetical protein n=1 Tax=Deinococcus taeanensis TaxID=2737050 RepID=UPI001CDD5312|nr:hypothetical protein [Deinococcus taeanensis]UBV41552.1 hypothetical protein LAJ19_07710 [Deinococcus taeanensis]